MRFLIKVAAVAILTLLKFMSSAQTVNVESVDGIVNIGVSSYATELVINRDYTTIGGFERTQDDLDNAAFKILQGPNGAEMYMDGNEIHTTAALILSTTDHPSRVNHMAFGTHGIERMSIGADGKIAFGVLHDAIYDNQVTDMHIDIGNETYVLFGKGNTNRSSLRFIADHSSNKAYLQAGKKVSSDNGELVLSGWGNYKLQNLTFNSNENFFNGSLEIEVPNHDPSLTISRNSGSFGGSQDNLFEFKITSNPNSTRGVYDGSLSIVAKKKSADFSVFTQLGTQYPQLVIDRTSNLGIGLQGYPQARIHAYVPSNEISTNALESAEFLLKSDASGTSGKMIGMGLGFSDPGSSDNTRSVGLYAQSMTTSANEVDMLFYTKCSGNCANGSSQQGFDERMRLTSDGQLLIGTSTPVVSDYKMIVDGKIGVRSVKVDAAGQWPDYVFDTDYELTDLDDVERFIKNNGHLRDIPSEEEVENDGFDVAEMDAALLKKVEELTLYVIQQNKLIQAQQKELQDQKKRLDNLENVKLR